VVSTLERRDLLRALTHAAQYDSLTGLRNRRAFQDQAQELFRQAEREGHSLSVAMLDLDHFKRFNDTYGHDAGDALMRLVGSTLQRSIRAEDIACRYGGEEFTIILPDTTVKGACDRADSILNAIANLRIASGHQTFSGLSVSIGIAFYPGDGETAEEVLQNADVALYDAKHNGRNQVCLFERAFSAK